jgi:hypothetical protein
MQKLRLRLRQKPLHHRGINLKHQIKKARDYRAFLFNFAQQQSFYVKNVSILWK